MKIGLVTDSASDISFQYAKEKNIKITSQHVLYDDIIHTEDETFDFEYYYRQFEERSLFKVTTSQPSPGDFLQRFEELRDEGYDFIICATVSSGLSGTYNSAVQAARALEEENPTITVKVVDSKSASAAVILLLELALEMIDQGSEPIEIVMAMEERVTKIKSYLSLPTLKYLRAGGRVSTPKFIIGSLIGLKPITYIEPENGKNEAIGTSFSMGSGIKKIYDLMTEHGTNFASEYSITHTNDEELAEKLVNYIRSFQPDVNIKITRAGSSISAHAGPGAIGLFGLFE